MYTGLYLYDQRDSSQEVININGIELNATVIIKAIEQGMREKYEGNLCAIYKEDGPCEASSPSTGKQTFQRNIWQLPRED